MSATATATATFSEAVEHPFSKEELWKDAVEKEIEGGAMVQMIGMESSRYGQVVTKKDSKCQVTIATVVETMVDEGWKNVAKDILENKEHIELDSHPAASKLLELGAVWLLNKTAYIHSGESHNAHARRVQPQEEAAVPDWQDMTIRVHYVPDCFHAANEVDWSKPCRGLLIGDAVQVTIGGNTPHVSVAEGLPDDKDGVLVYKVRDVVLGAT
jgi:hypothetical protein